MLRRKAVHFGCLGLPRTRGSVTVCYSTRESVVPQTQTRESKRSQAPENRGSPLARGLRHTSPEMTHLQKRFERHLESLARLAGKGLPCTKPVPTDWKRWLFVHMLDLNKRSQRIQRNKKTWPKGTKQISRNQH